MPVLSALFHYPVKSFPAVPLLRVKLSRNEGLPNDRRYAITNGITNTLNGDWLTCRSFFINSLNDGMLKFSLEIVGETIRITSPDGISVSFQRGDVQSLEQANRRLAEIIKSLAPSSQAAEIPPSVITERRQSGGAMSGYWDFTDSAISIMNHASLASVARAAGRELDIRRLRGNLVVEGLQAWEEFGWLGKRLKIGGAELEVFRPAQRCPATSVNPVTGERDVRVPDAMNKHFGHAFCGMYAKCVKSGEVQPGDRIDVIGDAYTSPEEAALPSAPDYKIWPKMAEIISHQSGESSADFAIRSPGNWPLPEALPGQRLRVHIGQDLIGMANVIDHRDHTTVLHVEPSATGDPATEYLLKQTKSGDRLIVTGPFGRE